MIAVACRIQVPPAHCPQIICLFLSLFACLLQSTIYHKVLRKQSRDNNLTITACGSPKPIRKNIGIYWKGLILSILAQNFFPKSKQIILKVLAL